MTRQLVTSHGGRWVVAREGRALTLFASDGRRQAELAHDDVDLAFVHPPDTLVEVARTGAGTIIALRDPPSLEPVTKIEIDVPARLGAITGSRLALVAPDSRHCAIVRVAPRALAQQAIDVGAQFEFVIGLERDQLLFGLAKELKVWDAVAARPLVKLALPLPPPPRTVGVAAGHVWATRPDSDEVYVYRLSDGRPFQHRVGSAIERVISAPTSPVLVLVTGRGLVRLHCLAHTVTSIERAPWTPPAPGQEPMPLAQLVVGSDDITLLGFPEGASQPWRVVIAGSGQPRAELQTEAPAPAPSRHQVAAQPAAAPAAPAATRPSSPTVRQVEWREAYASYGEQLLGGRRGSPPDAAGGLAELAARLALGAGAVRALSLLYSLYLVGEPAISIARLAHELGDWTEALGRGELAALALLRRKAGNVTLRTPVSDLLDGAPPRAVRLVGATPSVPRAGAFRVSRDGRPDAEIETELAHKLGRIAIAQGPLPRALLEARLHGATTVAFSPPGERPTPWPRDAGLVLVLYGNPSAWVADVPAL
ncbi:MAG: hypothetical protein ACM31C_29490 [Acidobacteriota bacterium]